MQSLRIKPDERVIFAGKTGSGKTYLASHLIASHKRVVVIDPKGTYRVEDGWIRWGKKAKQLLRGNTKPFRILVPPMLADKIDEAYEEVFEAVYGTENCLIYIDELYGVTATVKGGAYLRALYTRGRELNISVWGATQRPSWIPRYCYGEAEWFFCFRLQLLADRARMAEMMGKQALSPIPDEHGFLLYHTSMDKPLYVPKLSVRE